MVTDLDSPSLSSLKSFLYHCVFWILGNSFSPSPPTQTAGFKYTLHMLSPFALSEYSYSINISDKQFAPECGESTYPAKEEGLNLLTRWWQRPYITSDAACSPGLFEWPRGFSGSVWRVLCIKISPLILRMPKHLKENFPGKEYVWRKVLCGCASTSSAHWALRCLPGPVSLLWVLKSEAVPCSPIHPLLTATTGYLASWTNGLLKFTCPGSYEL